MFMWNGHGHGLDLQHLECSIVESGQERWVEVEVEEGVCKASIICLIISIILSRGPGDPADAPLAGGAFGLGERLLVGMLLGVHLLIQKVWSQLVSIVYLHLQNEKMG